MFGPGPLATEGRKNENHSEGGIRLLARDCYSRRYTGGLIVGTIFRGG